MRLGRIIVATAASVLAALLFTGCGGTDESSSPSPRSGGTEAGGEEEGPQDEFASIPRAAPGELRGRIVYLTPECERRSYDLATGEDVLITQESCNDGTALLFSPDGRLLVRRAGSEDQYELVDEDGDRIAVGPPHPLSGRGGAEYMGWPRFSPDSRRIAVCTARNGDFEALIADTESGGILERVSGTCEVAFTAEGLAVLRDGRLSLGERVLFESSADVSAVHVTSDRGGTLLAVTTRLGPEGADSPEVEIAVVSLDGEILSRQRRTIPIRFSLVELGPTGRSALAWWGCILQLVPFADGQFGLLFGESGSPISGTAFSPDGEYAVMGRVDFSPIPSGGPVPERRALDAVVFDAEAFAPHSRLPISAQVVAWVP